MEKEIFTEAIELITKDCKDTVSINKKYRQYLEELTEKRVNDIISIYASMQYEEDKLEDINNIFNNIQVNKINYLEENISDIVHLEFTAFPEEFIKEIYKIVERNGYIEYSTNNMPVSINYIIIMRKLGLIFIKTEEDKVKVHMPEEILDIINKELKSDSINKSITEKNIITEFIQGLLNAYGMISITESYILFTKLYKFILPEIFNRYIFFISNILHEKFKSDDVYLYNINLLDDEIPELEEIHSRLEYHFYNLDELKLLANNEYYTNYMQYKVIEEFIENNLNVSVEKVKIEIIDWYIVLAQMDLHDAEDYMDKMINDLDLDNKRKESLKQHIRDIYEICPKWKLKGSIKYKKNKEVKILQFPNN